MDGFEIVPTSFDDPVAQSLVAELMADLDERYGGEDSAPVPDPQEFAPPDGVFLVAHLDGEAVACGGVRPLREGVAEIKRMFVRPRARGRGISRSLLIALEDAARQAGYRELWLETGLGQPEAMRLYEASGYAPIAPYGHYKDHEDSRCYGKRLK